MRFSIPVSAALLVAAWPAATQQPSPLAQVERGRWDLRTTGGTATAAICLGNPILLAQPQNAPHPCSSEILSTEGHVITVSFVCPGMGRGRALLRVETPRLVQIDSQGVSNGAPFALRAQARRTGPC
jgi:hypothetical protein